MATDPLEQVIAGFLVESQELCQRLTLELLTLEKSPAGSEAIAKSYKEVARSLHTLKGSAATLGLDALADLAHELEEVIAPGKAGLEPLTPTSADQLLSGLDRFLTLLRNRVSGTVEPILIEPEPTEAANNSQEDRNQWRVDAAQVTSLIRDVERLRELQLRLDHRRRELERAQAGLKRLAMFAETAEVRAILMGQSRALALDADEAGDIVHALEDGVKVIATVPVRTILDPLQRSVRDLCRLTGKEARLAVVGAEISLDRRVLEALRGPLVHLVRNGLDHGVERPEDRLRRGKHREGALVVRVEQQGNLLFIEVSDDGNGLDLDAIRQAAQAQGRYTHEQLAAMEPAQIAQLIFDSGFSTRTEVTALSGRGIGLDAVRNEVVALRGKVEVQFTEGQGTRFILTVPIDLGSSPMLLVRCGEQEFALPMLSVECTLPGSAGSGSDFPGNDAV